MLNLHGQFFAKTTTYEYTPIVVTITVLVTQYCGNCLALISMGMLNEDNDPN